MGRAIDFVIQQPDPEQAELSKIMRVFLGAVIKLIPGLSETSLVVGLINKAIEALGSVSIPIYFAGSRHADSVRR